MGNALRLLLLLRSRGELRISECARELGVARSTAHRLLTMLEHYEFLARDPSGRGYRSGPALIGLGLAAIGSLDIRTRARPHLQALRDELDETVSLVLLEGRTARFVDAVESGRPLRVTGRIGLELPAHRTSAGVAVIAAMEEAERAEHLVGRAGLERAVRTAREQGYAVVHNESDIEIAAVGVAVPGTRAGLAVAAPAGRATEDAVHRWAATAKAAARRIAIG